jgi:hypothetical protein
LEAIVKTKNFFSTVVMCAFGSMTLILSLSDLRTFTAVRAQTSATPAPFDQKAAIAALKEQIKGHENDPAPTVFKNIKFMTTTPAGRLLSVMEFGFSRALGVDCTHCHVPGKWEVDDKPEKQIARDMSDMNTKINKELLRNIKNLKDANPIVNCTTCHRGQVKPAVNLPSS